VVQLLLNHIASICRPLVMRPAVPCDAFALQEIQDELIQVQQQMSGLAAERFLGSAGPVDQATAEALESGAAVPWNPTADTAAIIAADAAVAQEQALSGLQGVVATWQQELMEFRQVRVKVT
jgi:hypothetical protein